MKVWSISSCFIIYVVSSRVSTKITGILFQIKRTCYLCSGWSRLFFFLQERYPVKTKLLDINLVVLFSRTRSGIIFFRFNWGLKKFLLDSPCPCNLNWNEGHNSKTISKVQTVCSFLNPSAKVTNNHKPEPLTLILKQSIKYSKRHFILHIFCRKIAADNSSRTTTPFSLESGLLGNF